MSYTEKQDISTDKIQSQFRETNSFNCIFPFINRDTDIHISTILHAILKEVHQEEIYLQLEYTLNELSMNASKANSKRIYFQSKGLNITDSEQYDRGITNFKEDVFNNFSKYEQLHYDNNCYVKINITKENNSLVIEVTNNSPLLDFEIERIEQKIKLAKQFDNLEDVLAYGFDTTEGGGFGLIIMLLMLRKINLDDKCLSYSSGTSSSTFSLTIPLNIISHKQVDKIADLIVKEIDLMPQFPQSIRLLQKELSDPNCSFNSVAETINTDPSLSAEIIRIANSPVYRLKNDINDVKQAVRLIGMLGVKALLYNYGVNEIYKRRYNNKEIKSINHHSYYVAIIASYLMQYKKLNRLAEDVYVASLLHDMGKIIVNALGSDIMLKLAHLCKEKHIPITVIEDLTEGYNHALIGSEVAKKWSFPEKFVDTIRYHHIPLEGSEDYKALTYSVYMGNEIYHLLKKRRDFNDLNYIVLNFFGLETEAKFFNFIDSLNQELLIPDLI